jgi:hypothetical protein
LHIFSKLRVISTYDHVKWNAGGGDLKIWDVAGNIFNKQSLKGISKHVKLEWGFGWIVTISSPQRSSIPINVIVWKIILNGVHKIRREYVECFQLAHNTIQSSATLKEKRQEMFLEPKVYDF